MAVLCLFLTADSFSTYTWKQRANFGGTARHRGSAFVIGNKGYIGLGHINAITNILFEDFWEYDPGSNTWTQKANFGGGLRYHTIAFTIGEKAYVGTGRDQFNQYHNDLWEYDPKTNSWTQKASKGSLPIRGGVGFAINGKGYCATGQTKFSPYRTNELWEYNPQTNSWVQKASMPTAGRYSAVGFVIGNKGYVGTGYVGGSTNDLWEYDPATNNWTQKANIGPTNRMEATAFALNGKGYIGTGDNFSSGTNYGDMWEFDPVTNTCTQMVDFKGAKRRYMLSFSIGDKAYAGTGTNGTNFNDFWEWSENVDIDEFDASDFELKVYPNPCTNQSTFEIKTDVHIEQENLQLLIFDVQGKVVRNLSVNSDRTQFYRNDLNSGIYVYHLMAGNKTVGNGKLILK